MSQTVTVEVDQSMHTREPVNEVERLTWAALDTAWKLLREYSVRLVMLELRSQAEVQGVQLPSDEELFSQESDDPDFPRSYLDLAPEPEVAGRGLQAILNVLYAEALAEAQQGFGPAGEGL